MTLSVEEADELAGAIGIFLAAGPLLWMISGIGETSTARMVAVFESIVHSIVVSSPHLIVALLVVSFGYSLDEEFTEW